MKYLGIDYGGKRTGVSLSDDGGTMAFPHSVIETERALSGVLDLIEKEKVGAVVLGESLKYDNTPNEIMKGILRFKEKLEKENVIVYFQKEFLTSQESEHIQGKTDMIDASAATLILQAFLDKKK